MIGRSELVNKRYFIVAFISILLILVFTNNLDLIKDDIPTESWCEMQPCMEINVFSQTMIISQPSSSIFVYLLGIIASILGIEFLRTKQEYTKWWGMALILWGMGALFAGTSYQAFSYEIKCSDVLCDWTSWWEVYYLILSVSSVCAMVIANSLNSENHTFIRNISFAIAISYSIAVLVASVIPIRFLVSFEFMLLILVPMILYMFIVNLRQYRDKHLQLDRSMIIIWINLAIIMIFYYGYLLFGFTDLFWEEGFWFSENDVLHILLITWMIRIRKSLNQYLLR